MATQPLPSWGPTSGQLGKITPVVFGVPEVWSESKEISRNVVRDDMGGNELHSPCGLGVHQSMDKVRSDNITLPSWGKSDEWLRVLYGLPTQNWTKCVHSCVSSKWRHNTLIKSGHMALDVLGAFMWAKLAT